MRTTLIIATSLALISAPGYGQASSIRTEKLADGIYAIIRGTEPANPSDANTTVIINDNDVIVVDANITPGSSRRVIAEIKRLTPKPVRYVINTHVHSDHTYGNMAYAEAYPGVEFIAHPGTREDYIKDDIPAFENNEKTEYPGQIAAFRAALARGKTRDGSRNYTEKELASYRQQIAVLEWFLAETKGLKHTPATLMVSDSLVLHRGARRIVVLHPGRANTRGDLVVYLPEEQIMATGDIIVSPVPFAWGSHPADWVKSLDRLMQHPVIAVVPGHGEVQRDWSYANLLKNVFQTAIAKVPAAAAKDTSIASIQKAVDLSSFKTTFIGGNDERLPGFNEFVAVLVERVYAELKQ